MQSKQYFTKIKNYPHEKSTEPKILRYYERNGFVPLYKTDVIEKQYYDIPQDEPLKTRLLYFDLKKD